MAGYANREVTTSSIQLEFKIEAGTQLLAYLIR